MRGIFHVQPHQQVGKHHDSTPSRNIGFFPLTVEEGWQYRHLLFHDRVPRERLELSLHCYNWILSPARLPIPPPRPTVHCFCVRKVL